MKNKNGFTSIELIIVLGLLFLTMSLSVSFSISFLKEFARTSKVTEAVLSQNLVQTNLMKNESCNCMLKNKVFRLIDLNFSEISLDEIRSGCLSESPILFTTSSESVSQGSIKVSKISIDQITPTGNSDEYNARLNIQPISSSHMRMPPLIMRFHAEKGAKDDERKIVGCGPSPLTIPKNLTVASSSKSCLIKWTQSSGANPKRYVIKYSDVSGKAALEGTIACYPEVLGTSCLISNLADEVPYYISVKAINSYEETSFSEEISCVPRTMPTFPQDFKAESGIKKCSFSWVKPELGSGEIEYVLFKMKEPDAVDKEKVCETKSTSCEVNLSSDSMVFYFKLLASNKYGDSSSTSYISCKALSAPSAPREVEIKGGEESCQLSWIASETGDNVKYQTYLKSAESVAWQEVCALSADTNCLISSLKNESEYSVYIKASNSAGEMSSDIMTCKPGTQPGKVTILNKQVGSGVCTFSWTVPTTGTLPFRYTLNRKLTEIEIEQAKKDQATEVLNSGTNVEDNVPVVDEWIPVCEDVEVNSCESAGLEKNVNYLFTVFATNSYGDSEESDTVECLPNVSK